MYPISILVHFLLFTYLQYRLYIELLRTLLRVRVSSTPPTFSIFGASLLDERQLYVFHTIWEYDHDCTADSRQEECKKIVWLSRLPLSPSWWPSRPRVLQLLAAQIFASCSETSDMNLPFGRTLHVCASWGQGRMLIIVVSFIGLQEKSSGGFQTPPRAHPPPATAVAAAAAVAAFPRPRIGSSCTDLLPESGRFPATLVLLTWKRFVIEDG